MSDDNDSQEQQAPSPEPQRRPTFAPEYDRIKEGKEPRVYGQGDAADKEVKGE